MLSDPVMALIAKHTQLHVPKIVLPPALNLPSYQSLAQLKQSSDEAQREMSGMGVGSAGNHGRQTQKDLVGMPTSTSVLKGV